MYHNKTS